MGVYTCVHVKFRISKLTKQKGFQRPLAASFWLQKGNPESKKEGRRWMERQSCPKKRSFCCFEGMTQGASCTQKCPIEKRVSYARQNRRGNWLLLLSDGPRIPQPVGEKTTASPGRQHPGSPDVFTCSCCFENWARFSFTIPIIPQTFLEHVLRALLCVLE